MGNLVNFVLFQALWFAAVAGGARGEVWWGPAALVPCLVGFLTARTCGAPSSSC